MRCPKCFGPTHVTTTYQNDDNTRRRRECTPCQFRFTTYERALGSGEVLRGLPGSGADHAGDEADTPEQPELAFDGRPYAGGSGNDRA